MASNLLLLLLIALLYFAIANLVCYTINTANSEDNSGTVPGLTRAKRE